MIQDNPTLQNLFSFIYHRQLIWYKRFILKEPAPRTNDTILQTYKIINIYRELDKCTQYIVKKCKNIKDRKELFLNILFFRFFNLTNLYEDLGIDVLSTFDEKTVQFLDKQFALMKKKRGVIFNNAYIISSGGAGPKHTKVLQSILDRYRKSYDMIQRIDQCKTPRESLDIMGEIHLVGPFLACEIWTDLCYFNFFKQCRKDNSFVNIGPGAKRGLELLFGKLNNDELYKKLDYLYQQQKVFLPDMHKELKEKYPRETIAYKEANSSVPFISITNMEGSLCEFRKYRNISHGTGRKKYFKANI